MIVTMMVMVNKIYLNSRQYCLLFLLVSTFFSCKKKESTNIVNNKRTVEIQQSGFIKRDSLTFSVLLPSKKITGFNVMDNYLQNNSFSLKNNYQKDTIISKNILRPFDSEIIVFLGSQIINGNMTTYWHYYFKVKEITNLNFKYDKGDMILLSSNNVILVDKLYYDYNRISSKIFSKKDKNKNYIENLRKELDNVFLFFKDKYAYKKDKILLNHLNKTHFIANLQGIDPYNDKIKNFLIKIKEPIASSTFSGLIYTYAKNRIHSFNYKELNTKYYSKEYTKLVSIGVFNFLRHEDNKGNKQYKEALNWLKTTDLYKQDSIYIKKEITPLNNTIFKKKLKSLVLLDTSFNNTSFSEMLKKKPSKYYLIDFWATWCAPCIEGVNSMKKMRLPKNVKIISLSLDKLTVKDKWKSKTKELGQTISFLVDGKNQKNKEFLKFIELQSVPRYILIDKNMNLIDEAFLHPNELQFLPKLKDVKNHKYW